MYEKLPKKGQYVGLYCMYSTVVWLQCMVDGSVPGDGTQQPSSHWTLPYS